MEDWSKDFFQTLETVTNEVEQFFTEVAKDAIEVMDVFVKLSEEMTEQLQISLQVAFDEIEQNWDELVEPQLIIFLTGEELEESIEFYRVDTPLQRHPVCVGCQHYHGQSYSGNLLVCAMHPYGWEGETCPDWQAGENRLFE